MSSINIKIETARLIIRPFQLDDIDAAHEMDIDPEVNRFTGDGGVVYKKETERRILEDVMGDYKKYGFGRFAVELKEENKFIGFTGLKYIPDLNEVDLGYRFMKKYWGKGIATESAKASIKFGFDELNLNRIIALVLPENIASIRILEKLGFEFEREVIEDIEKANQYSLHKK